MTSSFNTVLHAEMFDCVYAWPLGEVWRCELTHSDLAQPDILSGTERERAQRFFRESDRQRYIASHVGLRHVLADKLDTSPEALVFGNGPHGKPYLPSTPGCHFNLSHSGGAALIAVSMQCEVGVDIEQMRVLGDADGLVQRHFTPAEQQAWQRLAPTERQRAFHQTWARKEACVKAVGWGLRLPLHSLHVGSDPALVMPELHLPDGSWAVVSVLSLPQGDAWAAALAWLSTEDDTP